MTDDLIPGAQAASITILEALMNATTTSQGVHIESLVTALGALAGRACQAAAIDGITNEKPEYAGMVINVVTTAAGEELLFGDALNRPLAESEYSVWGLVAGKAQQLGAELPNPMEIFQNAASAVGTDAFGMPRYEGDTGAADTPRGYLALWAPIAAEMVKDAPDPQAWPIAYGLAAQRLFDLAGGQFDLGALTRVLMDSAVATSKIQP